MNPALDTAVALVPLHAALCEEPHNPCLLRKIARLFGNRGMYAGAISYVQQALGISPEHPALHRDLGEYLFKSGLKEKALFHLRRASTLEPQNANNLRWLAAVLCSVKQFDLAIVLLKQARDLPNCRSLTLSMLSKACYDNGDFKNARAFGEEAVALSGAAHKARLNLAYACCELGDFERALSYARQEAKRRPGTGLYLLASVLCRMNRVPEQVDVCRRLIRIQPNNGSAHFLLAWGLLMLGDFANGWKEYEWRLNDRNVDEGKFRSRLTEPMWEGQELSGKTILVHGEQGFGDNIQFVRYINNLLSLHAEVILLAPRDLVRLYKQIPGIKRVYSYMQLAPRYDYHVVVGSLPRLFSRDISEIPSHVPYLFAGNEFQTDFRPRNKHRLNVGIVWAGTKLGPDDKRAVDIHTFSGLFSSRNVDFYSLLIQKGPKSEDINPFLRKNVYDASKHIHDFLDTALVLKKLDLLVSIDSGIAHLAGALGCKVFTLLPFAADFRWLLNSPGSLYSEKTPWYPTMRVFRQPKFGDWRSAISKVRHALEIEAIRKSSTCQVDASTLRGADNGEFLTKRRKHALANGEVRRSQRTWHAVEMAQCLELGVGT